MDKLKIDSISYESKLLIQFPFLKEIDEHSLNKFLETVKIMNYPPKTIILDEGDSCTNMVLILSGVIRVYKISPEGKEITLYRLQNGETCVLSISCIMGETNYPAIAEVEENAVLAIIPAHLYNELFLKEPAIQHFIFNTISLRLQEVLLLIDEVVFKSMDRRLASYLLERAEEDCCKNEIQITHEKIAIELGTAREVISRLLKDFENKSIVSLSRGKIVVKNKNILKKIAEV